MGDIVRPNMDYETVVRKMAPAAVPFSWLNCDLDLDEIDGKLDWLHKNVAPATSKQSESPIVMETNVSDEKPLKVSTMIPEAPRLLPRLTTILKPSEPLESKDEPTSKQCVKEAENVQKYKCKCIICHKKFFSLRKLYTHEALHPKVKKIHECNVCYRVFIHKSSLLLHHKNHKKSGEEVKIVKKVEKFLCRGCNKYITKEELPQHKNCYFSCNICNRKFNSYNGYNRHLEQCFRTKICFEDTSYAAKILIEMSEKPVEFLVNPMVENPSEMVTNPLVEKSEKPVDTWVKPMVEIPSEMVTNPLFEKSEKPMEILVKPMVEIPSEMMQNPLNEPSEKLVDIHVKPLVEIASKMITTPLAEIVESEVQKLKPKKKRTKSVFPCKYCGKIFDRIGHVQNHEKTHTGELPYECEHCDRKFAMLCNMRRHVDEMHNNVKKYECDKCGKKMSRKYHLQRHKETMEYFTGRCKTLKKNKTFDNGSNMPMVSKPMPMVPEPMHLISKPMPMVDKPMPVVSKPMSVVSNHMPMVSKPSNGTQTNPASCSKCQNPENQLECSIKFGTNQIVFSYKNCTCTENSTRRKGWVTRALNKIQKHGTEPSKPSNDKGML